MRLDYHTRLLRIVPSRDDDRNAELALRIRAAVAYGAASADLTIQHV